MVQNVKLHVDRCLANPTNTTKGKGKQVELFFPQGDRIHLGMIVKEN